jgi:hypothetical protein
MEFPFQKVLLTSMTGIAGFGTYELKDISNNLQALNVKMAVVVERVAKHDMDIQRINDKLDKTELSKKLKPQPIGNADE